MRFTALLVAALIVPASCSPVSATTDPPFPSPNSTIPTSSAGALAAAVSTPPDDNTLRQYARKRGIAWQLRSSGTLAPFRNLASYYTYGPYGYAVPDGGPGFVPQLWGCSDAHVAEFEGRMKGEWGIVGQNNKSVLLKNKELLTFNEPNEVNQANCTPARAAAVWKRTIEPLRKNGWRVGAPAVNTNSWGMTWMLDFWRECNGSCNPDFLAVHFYNPSESALAPALTQWHTTFDLPVQVTEIAPMSWPPRDDEHVDAARVVNYMRTVMAWMDGTEWVERYYWYGARWNMGSLNPELALLRDSRTLTPLGQLYVTSQSPRYASTEKSSGARLLASVFLITALLVSVVVLV